MLNHVSKIDPRTVDNPAPCIIWSVAAMVSTMWDKLSFVFHGEEFHRTDSFIENWSKLRVFLFISL